MAERVVVLDTETVPDLEAGRRLLDCGPEVTNAEVRVRMADHCRGKNDAPGADVFIKPILQKVVAVSVLEASRPGPGEAWQVGRFGSMHSGKFSEAKCIQMVEAVLAPAGQPAPRPQAVVVGWNTSGFDLPLLRYRSMALRVPAPVLNYRLPSNMPAWKFEKEGRTPPLDYWKRYDDGHCDLMDILASFGASGKAKLVEVAAVLGLPGKAGGVEGSQVEPMVNTGRIEEVAHYCEGDVGLLFGVWLRYQLAAGLLDEQAHAASWASFATCVRSKQRDISHLTPLLVVADQEVQMLRPATSAAAA